MKFLTSQLLYFIENKTTRSNLFFLLRFFILLMAIVTLYSVFFHFIMVIEGRDYSWVTGFYWTLTVMSTLGFGDITFETDIGKMFSMFVLLSGIVMLLVMLPFTFIQFFYAPWLEAQSKARTPKELPEDTEDHVLITNLDPITRHLIKKLEQYNYPYALIAKDLQQALEYHNQGYRTVYGDPGDPETYLLMRVENAALVVATGDDEVNTNISFTVREVCGTVPIVTNADYAHSLDILESAGSTHIFQFMKMLGNSLGRRTLGVRMGTNIIWQMGDLLIAEAPAMRTSLEGKNLAETRLREKTGVTVVGVWERGHFSSPHPHETITSSTVLVLAGSKEQLEEYDKLYSLYCAEHDTDVPLLILGGGRVGHAAAESLKEHNIPYKIIEKNRRHVKEDDSYIYGNAADIKTLAKAGIGEARSVIITTHNDDINIYLTIYCRQLRPDIQIITRANRASTVSKLHRAGADLVMSYATMGSNTILNLLNTEKVLMVVEGLSIFKASVSPLLAGRSVADNMIREKTGCSVIAIKENGALLLNPDPFSPLHEGAELVLIGTADAEKKFMDRF